MTALALATCSDVPTLDAEGRFLRSCLTAAGIDSEPVVWNDSAVDWSAYERVLIRSTWDYQYEPEQFLAWTNEIGERLLNTPRLVGWNASKRYLAELDGWGVPVVPSRFVAPGEDPALPRDGEFVVKPATSAGSKDTARYRGGEAAASAHVEALLEDGREVLVQPYLDSVDRSAETAVVLFNGEVSHAMRKGPLLELDQEPEPGLFRQEQMSLREASPAQLDLARQAVTAVADQLGDLPLYARVDMLDSDDGEPVILELELIEPSLFLDFHHPAAERLASLLSPLVRR